MFVSAHSKSRWKWIVGCCLAGVFDGSIGGTTLYAQEQYQLVAPSANVGSKAERTDQELTIRDANGGISRYVRDPRMDSADGMWIGYTSRAARQVIRWPISNQGNMQIGTPDGSGEVRYRESKMAIVSLASRTGPAVPDRVLPGGLPPNTLPGGRPDPNLHRDRDGLMHAIRDEDLRNPVPLRLSNRADHQQFLSLRPDGNLGFLGQAGGQGMDWTMVPVANGMVRFQMQQANRVVALRCDPRSRQLSIGGLANDASQLWRWQVCPNTVGGYALESVLFPGQALAFQAGQFLLQPIGFGPAQQWYPSYLNPLPIDPTFRNVTSRVEPNPPLGPASIDLVNSHSEAIFVLLADKRSSGQVETFRIPPGQSQRVTLERDAGATVIETHEIIGPTGVWDRQEFVTVIPPAILYDVSVYEEFLQSIAIDRTGKSPNPIEDVNYQPKSLGWFNLPPGSGLPEQGSIDLHAQAKAARNPGAVRPIDRELLEKKKLPSEDPLKAILREFQGQRAAF